MSFLPLAIIVFLVVAVAVFAFSAATIAPKSVLSERLRTLGKQQPRVAEIKPALRDRLSRQLELGRPVRWMRDRRLLLGIGLAAAASDQTDFLGRLWPDLCRRRQLAPDDRDGRPDHRLR